MLIRLGIGGDGQLGRMLAIAAKALEVHPVTLGPESNSPTAQVAEHFPGDYRSANDVEAFGQTVDVVTVEYEEVNAEGLQRVQACGIPVYPTPESLLRIIDKFEQSRLFRDKLGLPKTAFAAVSCPADVRNFAKEHGYPVMLKKRHGSYDGYGNALVQGEVELDEAFARLMSDPTRTVQLYVEAFVLFVRELAQIITRGKDGHVVYYPLVETVQRGGICYSVTGPILEPALVASAQRITRLAAEELDYVGTLAIELFELPNGSLMANEMAPRVHNSGHWSIEGANASQFENHDRAVLGLPLIEPDCCEQFAMVNWLGEGDTAPKYDSNGHPPGWDEALAMGVHLHDYGKTWRKGRKLGHATKVLTEPSPPGEALRIAEAARRHIGA